MKTTKLMMALAAFGLAGGNVQAYQFTTEQLARISNDADLFIETWDSQGKPLATGSGFFYAHEPLVEGYIITNAHVLKGAGSLRLTSPKGITLSYTGLESYNEQLDIAVITFSDPTDSFWNGKLSKAGDKPQIGQHIWVGGHPEGLPFTFTEGMVSALWPKGIQISAPVSPGSSGSAVINENGHVIGVASQIYREGQNLNYAISIDVVDEVIEHKPASVPLIVDRSHWQQQPQNQEIVATQLVKPTRFGQTITAKDGVHVAQVLDQHAIDAISWPLRMHLESTTFQPQLFFTKLRCYYDLKDCTAEQARLKEEKYSKKWPIHTTTVTGKAEVSKIWADGGESVEMYVVSIPFHWTARNGKRSLAGDKVVCAFVMPGVHSDSHSPDYFILGVNNAQ